MTPWPTQCGPEAEVFGILDWLQSIFLGSGIAMTLPVATAGSATAQVNASHRLLDYVNTHFIIARVTTLNVETGVDSSIFGVPDPVLAFFPMGSLGASVTTALGSIA